MAGIAPALRGNEKKKNRADTSFNENCCKHLNKSRGSENVWLMGKPTLELRGGGCSLEEGVFELSTDDDEK